MSESDEQDIRDIRWYMEINTTEADNMHTWDKLDIWHESELSYE